MCTTIPSDETDYDIDGYVECSIDGGGWDGDTSVIGGNDCDFSQRPSSQVRFGMRIWTVTPLAMPMGQVSCQQPSNTSLDSTDCDDTDSTVYPSATELCDGQLNACGNAMLAGEVDNDGDGYSVCTLDAGGWDGLGLVVGGDDCADGDAFTFQAPPRQTVFSIACAMRMETVMDLRRCQARLFLERTVMIKMERFILPPQNCATVKSTPALAVSPSDEVDNDGDGYVECTWDSNGWDGTSTVTGGDDCDDVDPIEFPLQEWFQDADSDSLGVTLR